MDNLQTPSSKTNAYGYQIGELQSKVRQLTAEIDLIQQYIRALRRPPRWFQAPLAIGGSSPEDAPFVVTETGITSLAQDGQSLKSIIKQGVTNGNGNTTVLSESTAGHLHKIAIKATSAPATNGTSLFKIRFTVDGDAGQDLAIYDAGAVVYNANAVVMSGYGSTGDGSGLNHILVIDLNHPYKESVLVEGIVSGGPWNTFTVDVYLFRSNRVST